jgi:Flp pilus assembly protein TadG
MPAKSASRRRGAALVEASLVMIIFFLFLFGMFEYCRFLYTQNVLNNAVREGARFAVTNTGTTPKPDVAAYVNNFLAGQGAQLQGFVYTTDIKVGTADPLTGVIDTGANWQAAKPGTPIGVSITGAYNPVIPLVMMGTSITITAKSIMYSEAN